MTKRAVAAPNAAVYSSNVLVPPWFRNLFQVLLLMIRAFRIQRVSTSLRSRAVAVLRGLCGAELSQLVQDQLRPVLNIFQAGLLSEYHGFGIALLRVSKRRGHCNLSSPLHVDVILFPKLTPIVAVQESSGT